VEQHEVESKIEQLIDNHAMLMDGVQLVVHGQTKVDDRIDGIIATQASLGTNVGVLANELRWMRVALFLVLLWQVGSTVFASQPAQAMLAMVVP
jgi:hypothetical protein